MVTDGKFTDIMIITDSGNPCGILLLIRMKLA